MNQPLVFALLYVWDERNLFFEGTTLHEEGCTGHIGDDISFQICRCQTNRQRFNQVDSFKIHQRRLCLA